MTTMKLKNLFAAFVLTVLLVPSCKKDNGSDTTYLYFDGNISFTMPAYVKAGDSFTFDINEISTLTSDNLAKDEAIKYYVTDPYTGKNDTLDINENIVTFSVRDTLGSFSLIIKGFCSGFVNSSCEASFYTVNPNFVGGSLTETGVFSNDSHFTDSRDGNVYYYVKTGDLEWTRNNLAYAGTGIPYQNSEVMNTLFGRFYTFDQALTACPEGWRLPTDSECQAMIDNYSGNAGAIMANARFNDEAMWEYCKEVSTTNESGLGFIPAGYACASQNGAVFNSGDAYAAFWTSTEENGLGVYRYIHEKSSTLFRQSQSRDSFYLPVRCVKK